MFNLILCYIQYIYSCTKNVQDDNKVSMSTLYLTHKDVT